MPYDDAQVRRSNAGYATGCRMEHVAAFLCALHRPAVAVTDGGSYVFPIAMHGRTCEMPFSVQPALGSGGKRPYR